jgi:branched-subunit amino acid transport protein
MLGMGLLTLLLRSSFLLLPERVSLPPLLRRALRYVPAAVLTAIYAPELLVQSGAIDFSMHNPRLLAGVVAIGVAWRLRRTFFTIVAGMLALYAFGMMLV